MNWVLTILLCAILVELVLRLPFSKPLKELSSSSKRAMHVVTVSAASDHWKEKAMGAYARKTFVASLKIAGFLTLVLSVATLLVVGMDRLFGGFQAFILGWTGLGLSVVAATLYVTARKTVLHD